MSEDFICSSAFILFQEQVNYMQYNEKSDIWSLGCLIYELCALHPPFTATNQKDLAARIRIGKFSRIPIQYSEELNKVIASMLKVEVRYPELLNVQCNFSLDVVTLASK
jgi:NIMA (never in mitosis gene a)-related kinase